MIARSYAGRDSPLLIRSLATKIQMLAFLSKNEECKTARTYTYQILVRSLIQDLTKISIWLLIKFHYLNTYRYLEKFGSLERSSRDGPNYALFRAIEGIICSSIGKLWSHRDRLNEVLFRSTESSISITGYVDIVRAPRINTNTKRFPHAG